MWCVAGCSIRPCSESHRLYAIQTIKSVGPEYQGEVIYYLDFGVRIPYAKVTKIVKELRVLTKLRLFTSCALMIHWVPMSAA